MAGLDLNPEEFEERLTAKKARGRRDSRICVCGHGGGSHFSLGHAVGEENRDIATYSEGEVGCQPGRVPCQCAHFVWVLKSSDVRPFIQKTEGAGYDHALSKGFMSAHQRGAELEYREGLVCFRCGEDTRLVPIPYHDNGMEAARSTGRDMMLCTDCRDSIRTAAIGNG